MVPSRESATSLEQMLTGRISGVSVARVAGGGISVLIRGPRTFFGSEEPLFVVDGVPVETGPHGTLSWLRPQDIQSIAVLKGADATIFGVRGANGVIVIKTKGTH
jgi:iron complex outermembrane receptor protein